MISRRDLGKAAAMTMGGGIVRRPDQRVKGTQRAGVGPAPSSAFVVARRVIIVGPDDGLFVYEGTPGAGTLVASITASSGTDPYGNSYLAGITAYGNGSHAGQYVQVQDGYISLASAADSSPAVVAGSNGALLLQSALLSATDTVAGLALLSEQEMAAISSFDFAAVLTGFAGGATVYVPVIPDFGGVVETWHNMGATSPGWTFGRARYKLLADSGLVAVQIQALVPTTHPADGTVIWPAGTLPAAYQPLVNQRIVCAATAAIGTELPSLEFEADGSVECYGIGGTTIGRLDCYPILSTI